MFGFAVLSFILLDNTLMICPPILAHSSGTDFHQVMIAIKYGIFLQVNFVMVLAEYYLNWKQITRITLAMTIILTGCIPAAELSTRPTIQGGANPEIIIATSTIRPISSALEEYFLPAYYSDSYLGIVESSKSEQGLVIYSPLGETVWKPVIDTFIGHYPWIKVSIVELGTNEVFERYKSDTESDERTADLVVSSSPDGWLNYANSGQVEPYVTEEDLYIPPWTKLAPGIYTFSSDPMVIVYDKGEFTQPPQSMDDLIKMINENPATLDENITTYDVSQNSTGFSIYWYLVTKLGQTGWDFIDKIGTTNPVLKSSSSSIVSSIVDNEASMGLFVSPIAFLQEQGQHPGIGWTFIKDGQPILMRSIAITKKATSPNSARLLVDFLLSQEGQLALAYGWLTPFRSDIANVDLFKPSENNQAHIHFDQVIREVGLDNLIFINLDPEILDLVKRENFINQWNQAMSK